MFADIKVLVKSQYVLLTSMSLFLSQVTHPKHLYLAQLSSFPMGMV